MWGDFMVLPNLYKPIDTPSSTVTATALGLNTTNHLLNPNLCAVTAHQAATVNLNNTNPNHSISSNTNCNGNGIFGNLTNCQGAGLPNGVNATVNNITNINNAALAASHNPTSLLHNTTLQNKLYLPPTAQTMTLPQLTALANSQTQLNPSCGNLSPENTAGHYHIFVGDIAPEIETSYLRDKFSVFGRVTECKIIKDMHTQKPKGYGFVAYATKEEAEDALTRMNGRILGTRQIRTNWAIRRPPQPPGKDQKPLDYNEVFAASSESNCTIYVGGITNGLSEELLRESFKDFGEILEVRIFKEKGYAFVRFDTHEGATQAIIKMHGRDVGSQPCKCSWGKESNDQKDTIQNASTSAFSFYVNPIGYHYNLLSPQFPDLTAAASNYTVSLNNLQNLNSQDYSGYMVSPVPNGLATSNLGTLNGLINQFSTARDPFLLISPQTITDHP